MATTDTPRIILPLLPAPNPRSPLKKPPMKQHLREPQANDSDLDRFQRIQCRAVTDMKQLVVHVSSLLDSPEAKQAGICDWLANLVRELDEIDGYIRTGLYQYEQITIDSDGISSLDGLLGARPEFDDGADDENNEFGSLLHRLVTFWTSEVVSRGYELIHLLCGAIDFLATEKDFTALDGAHYPNHQASFV